MPELWQLSATEIRRRVAAGEVSCLEVADAHLARISALDPQLRAFLTVTGDEARRQAGAIDAAIAGGEPAPPLAGVPIALKDNFCTRGVRTTAGSRILSEWRPPYDATVTERLQAAGAVLLGKTNLDEFAMGSSTENSGFFTTRNPWNLERVPGGSSGGSAAAVAAGLASVACGSDTGGSVRQPASLCGIVGIKPTYGRVSRYGLIAYASSLDQIGAFGRDVRDAATLLSTIAGHDPRDSTSGRLPVPDYAALLTGDVRGLRIGVPVEYFAQGVDPAVAAAVRKAVDVLTAAGASAEETSTPHVEYALPGYYIIAPAEASSNLARYDGVRYGHRTSRISDVIGMFEATRDEGFGAEVKHRIMLGTYTLSAGYYDAYYGKALQVRTLIKQDFDRAFERFDVLITPTSPTVAFRIGEKSNDPYAMKLSDICTVPVNMAGVCAVSLPCGYHGELPVGLQMIGRAYDEGTVLRAAHAYEQATDWHSRWPPFSAQRAGP